MYNTIIQRTYVPEHKFASFYFSLPCREGFNMKGKSRKKESRRDRSISLSETFCSLSDYFFRSDCSTARFLISAAAALALCTMFTTVNLLNSPAEEQKSSPYHKYYTSIPVSYTHLDVYKRQVLVDMTQLGLVEITRKKVKRPLAEQVHSARYPSKETRTSL